MIWVNEEILTQNSLIMIQNTINKFQVLADLSQIPGKIHCEEGFSNFIADQWKIFITIYATIAL